MKKVVCPVLILLVVVFFSCSKEKINKPHTLSVSENFINPIGFYDSMPSFSWKIPNTSKSQSAYSISVASSPDLLPDNPDLWRVEKANSSQSNYVEYKGKPFASKQQAYWQVRFWDENGKLSEWSDIAHFQMGLLKNEDWKGKWIGYPYKALDTTAFGTYDYTPQYIRKDLKVDAKVVKARLYVTAKGVFEAQINGNKVGKDVMTPGWTSYNNRIETFTYDITKMLKKGTNTIGFILAPGWYAGRIGYVKRLWKKKQPPQVLCQLEIEYANGRTEVIKTDESWKASISGPIRFSEIYDGEVYDANNEILDWSKPKFNDTAWSAVEVHELDNSVALKPKRHQAVRNNKELVPISISINEDRKTVFDLGQNIVGVSALKIPMLKGDTLKVRYAEMLNDDGTLYTDNYRTAHSTNYFIADTTGWVAYMPKFTFHGFRYVEIEGYNTKVKPDSTWVKGMVQYSGFKQTGTFTTSHQKLNQLQSNIVWGLRGNFLDIPTDCPQRDERLGWTGDAQVFAPTSIYNADVQAFWMSWLQTMRDDQYENGAIPIVIPDIYTRERVSPGWGDAATIIPWGLYYRTGNIGVLQENYTMMKKWVTYLKSISVNHIPQHKESFADWLQPYSENGNRGDTPYDLIAMAYYAQSVQLTSKAAQVLGKTEDSKELNKLYRSIKQSFQYTFFEESGKIKENRGTQTGYLLALAFNLLSEEMSNKAIPNLIEKINEADNHLRTGFLGTPLLAPVLHEIDRTDLLYELLFKESYPSWFYSINQGATTMWERWNSYSKESGYGDAGMNSFNHYAYGAIGQWMYELIAGIRPLEAGYKKIEIAPKPPKLLTSASGTYEAPFGKIISSWNIKAGTFYLEVTIPSNTSANIVFPYQPKTVLVNGKATKTLNEEGIRLLKMKPGTTVFEYDFKENQ